MDQADQSRPAERPTRRSALHRLTTFPFILAVRGYQVSLRHVMGGQCRFVPTCSDYSIEAYETHGAVKGTWLTIRRIARCQPWGGSGFDPVPQRRR
ncbi:MAG: membrane protein insertion efficiency factor YidD [Planctomycetota bacterium]